MRNESQELISQERWRIWEFISSNKQLFDYNDELIDGDEIYNHIFNEKKSEATNTKDVVINLLDEFFNHKSDASNLEASQQEELQKNFQEWLDNR